MGRPLKASLALLAAASLTGCPSWPRGVGDLNALSGRSEPSLNPPQRKAFKPAWRQDLGERGAFMQSQTFIGGAAVHATRPLLAVVGYDGRLSFKHSESGEELWGVPLGTPGTSAPLFEGDRLFIATGDAQVSAYDVNTRELVWRRQLNGLSRAPLTLAGEALYVTDGTNTLYALSSATGQVLWQRHRATPKDFSLHGEARPLVMQGRVIMGFSDGILAAYDETTGAPIWERDLAPQRAQFEDVDADPVLMGGTLYAASAASGLYALNPLTGEERWFYPLAGVVSLAALDGDLIVGLQHGEVARFNPLSKQITWRARFGTEGAPSRPQRFPYGLAVTLSRGALYVLNAETGAVRDQLSAGSGLLSPIAMSEQGWLYVSSLNGFLYAFSPR